MDIGFALNLAEDDLQAVSLAKQLSYALILLVMTKNAFEEDKARCFQAGMNDFIAKPFVSEDLFAMVLKSFGGASNAIIGKASGRKV